MAHGRIGGKPVRDILILVEGGGDGRGSKAQLRRGMDAFLAPLKSAARSKALRWELKACGSRNEAFREFRNESNAGKDAFVVLLVDAEAPVSMTPKQHLASRDEWEIDFTGENALHLMVQVMETWILADADALSNYYGQGFRRKALPTRQNLEEVSKIEVERTLNRATEQTTKGRYHKIKHASDLLRRIDANKVRKRCRHCERLFNTVTEQIEAA